MRSDILYPQTHANTCIYYIYSDKWPREAEIQENIYDIHEANIVSNIPNCPSGMAFFSNEMWKQTFIIDEV